MTNRRERPSAPPATLRPMTELDLDGVLAVQAACYPASMQEPAAVELARLHARTQRNEGFARQTRARQVGFLDAIE